MRLAWLLQLFLFTFAVDAFATPTADQRDIPPELERSIEARIAAGHVPGMIIGIVDAAGKRYYSFGRVSLEDDESPAKDTIYEIGSVGKTFTATLLADMVLADEVGMADPVEQYLPDNVSMPRFEGDSITLEDLATHRSSLPRMPSNFDPDDPLNPFADYSVAELYDFLNNHQLKSRPGTERLYSNVGFGLLGHVLAMEAGQSYGDLIATRITEPLGMSDTAIALSDQQRQRFAPPYALKNGELIPVKNWDVPTLAGAGALRSSAADMLRYLAAELGLLSNHPLKQVMALTQSGDPSSDSASALGWSVSGSDQRRIYAHNGGTGGYRTFAAFVPSENRGLVVLSNSSVSVDDVGIRLLVESFPLSY